MKVPYGDRFFELVLPAGWQLDEVTPPPIRHMSVSLRDIVVQALRNPVEFPRLDEYLRDKSNILLVVPDTTRPCPLPDLLPIIIEHLKSVNASSSFRIIMANGTHVPVTIERLRHHVGAENYDRWPVLQHDANSKDVIEVGRTRRGTRVALNPIVLDSDAIIAISPVQHHYFAGFGGGPKLIVPGLTAVETTFQNHRLSLDDSGHLHPNCREGILEGNPVAEDIHEALSLCPPVLYLGLILNERWKVTDCMAGDIRATHRALAKTYHQTHLRLVSERRPLVIASAGGAPRDCNLIQSHRGLHRAFRLVKEGGRLLYFAQCEQGVGSSTFLPWFEFSTSAKIAAELKNRFTLNGQTAVALRQKTEKAEITLVSDLDSATVSKTGMKPIRPPKSEVFDLREALQETSSESRGWIIPQASEFLPLTSDEMRPEDRLQPVLRG
jgi:nickel-dependent lactate racemase